MQRFIEGVRSFELKRNLALMYAQEQYVHTPPTVEALRFTVQKYLRCVVRPVRSYFPHLHNSNYSSLSQPIHRTRYRHQPPKRHRMPNKSHNNPQPSDNNRSERVSTVETPPTSDCMKPENAAREEQIQAAWYAPVTSSPDFADTEDQIRVISTFLAGI